MKDQARLDPDLAINLFRLGESDPDVSMGGSMMAQIVRHPECPDSLLGLAAESDHDHLRKIALIRLAQNTEEAEQVVAPNRSLPPSQSSTSSVRGSED